MGNYVVLNLVISGIPSILIYTNYTLWYSHFVLNLVISGIPSIRTVSLDEAKEILVLNLVISGIPSIPQGMLRSIGLAKF